MSLDSRHQSGDTSAAMNQPAGRPTTDLGCATRVAVAILTFGFIVWAGWTCLRPPELPPQVLAQLLPRDTPGLIGQWYNNHPAAELHEVLAIRKLPDGRLVFVEGGNLESDAERWPCVECRGAACAFVDRTGSPDQLYVVRGDGWLDLHTNCEFGPCTYKRSMRPLRGR